MRERSCPSGVRVQPSHGIAHELPVLPLPLGVCLHPRPVAVRTRPLGRSTTVGRGDPRGLPRTLVLYGERELLRDQVEQFVERARAAGVEVTARMFPGMIQNWIALPA